MVGAQCFINTISSSYFVTWDVVLFPSWIFRRCVSSFKDSALAKALCSGGSSDVKCCGTMVQLYIDDSTGISWRFHIEASY